MIMKLCADKEDSTAFGKPRDDDHDGGVANNNQVCVGLVHFSATQRMEKLEAQ